MVKPNETYGQWNGKLHDATPSQMVLINLTDVFFKWSIIIIHIYPEHSLTLLTKEWVETRLEFARATMQLPISLALLLLTGSV